jgi:hypothetical protein
MFGTKYPIKYGDNRTDDAEPKNDIPDHFISHAATEEDNRQSYRDEPQGSLAAFRRLFRPFLIGDFEHGRFPLASLTPPSQPIVIGCANS